MPDFSYLLTTERYAFLKNHPRLGRRIILMGLGGSYAYGTDNENSDIDFRGVALNLPSDLLGLTQFEQYEDRDTVIYSFNFSTYAVGYKPETQAFTDIESY